MYADSICSKLTDNISSKALPYFLPPPPPFPSLYVLSETPLPLYPLPPFTIITESSLLTIITEYGQFNIVETGIKITSIRIFAFNQTFVI
ncbi:hypothetical protein CEXT_692941 [Caerostris extrusa]|uniref:Uncharacterized protein n=1 Tax=Caerostris extrusa TaxID=172846 RepID=A0AAV4TQL1_CAEEX|nr:hypothetical protein CEXT_692941 [Caerostris extrusa]